MTTATAPLSLEQLEGQLRASGVSITVDTQRLESQETVSLPLVDQAGNNIGSQDLQINVKRQGITQGFVLVYDTRSGEAVPVDTNRLPSVLSLAHRDSRYPDWVGKLKWTLDKNRAPKPIVGKLKCPLHPEHPEHERYYALGAEPCRKANLMSLMAVDDHVRIKHQRTWGYLEREQAQQERDEEREYRQFVMRQSGAAAAVKTASLGTITQFGAEETDLPPKSESIVPPALGGFISECKQCHQVFRGDSQPQADARRSWHRRKAHPKK